MEEGNLSDQKVVRGEPREMVGGLSRTLVFLCFWHYTGVCVWEGMFEHATAPEWRTLMIQCAGGSSGGARSRL